MKLVYIVMRTKLVIYICSFIFISIAATLWVYLSKKTALPIIIVDVTHSELQIFSKKIDNISSLTDAKQACISQGRKFIAATNGGIFFSTLKPCGLLIQNSNIITPINTDSGHGNFFIKPNGIFSVTNGVPSIISTEAFLKNNLQPSFAIQSGPMLIMASKINPDLSKNSTSLFTRNAIALTSDGRLYIAFSKHPVSLYDFATSISCHTNAISALYLDGAISGIITNDLSVNVSEQFASILVFSSN